MSKLKQQKYLPGDSDVCEFYDGKSVFITGAAGFLGVVLLETLLRSCPGIRKIFILLRPKKGVQPEDRKAEIFKREIFNELRENNPDVLKKVIVVSGDVSEDNLGMREEVLEEVKEEVSIIFHVAASISFFKPISFTVKNNVCGTNNVIDLCRKLRKLDAFVHTSTLYSFINQEKEVDEKIYDFPFKAEEVIRLSRAGDEDGLNRLYSMVEPPHLNYYTFSKGVAEMLIQEKASDLPVCIIRPSLIICCMKGSLPGYVEDASAMTTLCIAFGKGFLSVYAIYAQSRVEIIPADIAANVHIVSAFLQASKRLPSPFICNCTSADLLPYSWEDYIRKLLEVVKKHPLPNTYLVPNAIICKNALSYNTYALLCHYIPAYPIDLFLWMTGSKLRLVKLYRLYDKLQQRMATVLYKQYDFRCNNFRSLHERLGETDRERFPVHIYDFTIERLAKCITTGAPMYRVNNKPYEEDAIRTVMRYSLTYLMRCAAVGSIASIAYMSAMI